MSAAIGIPRRRFAITGGLSLLAEHIGQQLLDAGAAHVELIDNLAFHTTAHSDLLKDNRTRLTTADVRDVDALESALQGIDGVFHTAAFVTIPLARDPQLGVDVNVRGTGTVLDVAARTGVGKVVVSSSVALYGEPVDDPITEESPFRTVGLHPAAVLYGASKLMAEALCERAWQTVGLPYVALRYSSLYGESQRGRGLNAMHLWEALEQMVAGDAPTINALPNEAHDYLYAGDAARANISAMEADVERGAYTIATGTPATLAEAVNLLANLLGFSEPPKFNSTSSRLKFSVSEQLNYRIKKAADELGWTAQVDLRDGLSRIIQQASKNTERHNDDPAA
jgi:UDP-glucose 4-epimerase